MEPRSPALKADPLLTELQGKPILDEWGGPKSDHKGPTRRGQEGQSPRESGRLDAATFEDGGEAGCRPRMRGL